MADRYKTHNLFVKEKILIRSLKNINPNQLISNNKVKYMNQDMAESINYYFVNVGNMVKGKIPIEDTNFSNYLKSIYILLMC